MARMRGFGLFGLPLATCIFLSACETSSRETVGGETLHPTAENIPRNEDLAALIGMDTLRVPTELKSVRAGLAAAVPRFTLGSMEGDPATIFGLVEDVEVDSRDGSLAVLDSRFNEVRLFRPDGAYLGKFGGPGRGPNEFSSPEAIDRNAAGEPVILDRAGEVKTFQAVDGSFELRDVARLEVSVDDFCMVGDTVYLQGIPLQGPGIIHAYDSRTGKHLRSFGAPYRSEDPLVVSQMSGGRIACVPEAGAVVMMFENVPVLYGYSTGGDRMWVSRLADFVPMRVVSGVGERGPFVRKGVGQTTDYHYPATLVAIGGGNVLVQLEVNTPESVAQNRSYERILSYVVSAGTGQGAFVGSNLPPIFDAAGELLVGGLEEPYPQVLVLAGPSARR